jgi:hypothetical protein
MKTKAGILFFMLMGNVLWSLQFLFLGAIAGALVGCVAITRTTIFFLYARKNKKVSVWILIALFAVFITINIIKWESWHNILLIMAMAYTFGQWQENKTVLRGTLIWTTIFNCIYCVLVGAYTGALNEFMQTISASVALWRFRKRKEEIKC